MRDDCSYFAANTAVVSYGSNIQCPSGTYSAHLFFSELGEATLENALRTNFYRSKLSSVSSSLNSWSAIPFTEKRDIRLAGEDARVPSKSPSHTFFTGGTTGTAFEYEVSDSEQEFITEFYQKVAQSVSIRRVAKLLDGGQIFGRDIPTASRFHNVSMLTPGAMPWLTRELSRHFYDQDLPSRISILAGGERSLRAFALWLKATQPDSPTHWALDAILVYGTILTSGGRKDLSRILCSPVIDRWGLSEAIGGATECSCGWYHPDPVLYVEAISLFGNSKIDEGIAELVITPLFPFQQRQPLIRYRTGDIANVTRSTNCQPGEIAIRPLGRLAHSIVISARQILPEKTILEAVEDEEHLVRKSVWCDIEAIDPLWPVGRPEVSVKVIDKTALVTVILRNGSPREIDIARSRISERLQTKCPDVLDWLEIEVNVRKTSE